MNVEITYELKPLTPIFIGSGLGGPQINKQLLKGSDSSFKIPGSTIKGRIRYYCREYINGCNKTIFKPEDIENIFAVNGDPALGTKFCAFSDMISDGNLKKQDFQEIISLRNGNKISRKLGISIPKALFNTEIISFDEGSKFKGKIIFQTNEENNKYIALIIIGLRMLNRLGGGKTIGFGKAIIPLNSIVIMKNGRQIENIADFFSKYLEENL